MLIRGSSETSAEATVQSSKSRIMKSKRERFQSQATSRKRADHPPYAGNSDADSAGRNRMRRKRNVDYEPRQSNLLSHFSAWALCVCDHRYRAEMLALTPFIYAC
jgi:hypothetical protein